MNILPLASLTISKKATQDAPFTNVIKLHGSIYLHPVQASQTRPAETHSHRPVYSPIPRLSRPSGSWGLSHDVSHTALRAPESRLVNHCPGCAPLLQGSENSLRDLSPEFQGHYIKKVTGYGRIALWLQIHRLPPLSHDCSSIF